MKIPIKFLSIFIIFALVVGSSVEYVYASIHQDCACCNKKCQMAEKCHEAVKGCLCRYSVPFQVYLPKNDFLPRFTFVGFLAQRLTPSYIYQSKKDIFHPPKVKLS